MNGIVQCNVCHSKLVSPSSRGVSRAYDRHKSHVSSKQRGLNIFLVVGDCVIVGFQSLSKVKDEQDNGVVELVDADDSKRSRDSFINMAAGANDEATHRVESDDR